MRRPTLAQLGASVPAAVAGYASYRHIYHVAQHAGEPQSVAALIPLAVDGLILAATGAMAEDKRNGRSPRWSARVGLAAGIAATLAANIASAHPNVTARLVAAWPALAFLLAVEILARRGKLLPAEQPAEQLAEQPAPDEDEDLADEQPAPRRRWGRGDKAAAVRQLVTEQPHLAGQPDKVAELLAGVSVRHARRVLKEVTA